VTNSDRRIYVETTIKEQVKQNYCTWPGGPGCHELGQNGECCGAFDWLTLNEEKISND